MNELEEILKSIPKLNSITDSIGAKGAGAQIYMDQHGRLGILLDSGGWLGVAADDVPLLLADLAPLSD